MSWIMTRVEKAGARRFCKTCERNIPKGTWCVSSYGRQSYSFICLDCILKITGIKRNDNSKIQFKENVR